MSLFGIVRSVAIVQCLKLANSILTLENRQIELKYTQYVFNWVYCRMLCLYMYIVLMEYKNFLSVCHLSVHVLQPQLFLY